MTLKMLKSSVFQSSGKWCHVRWVVLTFWRIILASYIGVQQFLLDC